MTREPEVDAERLAALLDGRLSEAERSATLEAIARSPDLMEIYSDAVAATSATGSEFFSSTSATTSRPSISRRWMIAAVLVMIVGLAVFLQRRSEPSVAVFVASLPTTEIPDDMRTRPWSAVRGNGADREQSARSAKLGVLSVDFRLALTRGDTLATDIASAIVQQLAGTPAAGDLGITFIELAKRSGDPQGVDRLDDAEAALEAVGDREIFRLAAWVEAARVAARKRNAEFFASRASARQLERAQRLTLLSEKARTGLDQLQTLPASERNWHLITEALDEVIRALAD